MQALSRLGASLFSTASNGNASSGRRRTAKHELFARVDPAVDGPQCLHDCASCTVRYPAKFDVQLTDELYGEVKAWSTHLLVATGKSDWVRDVADEKGSVMEAIDKGVRPEGVRLSTVWPLQHKV